MNSGKLAVHVGDFDPEKLSDNNAGRACNGTRRRIESQASRKDPIDKGESVWRGPARRSNRTGIRNPHNSGRQGRRQCERPTWHGIAATCEQNGDHSQQRNCDRESPYLLRNMNAPGVLLVARAGQVQCHYVTSCGISGASFPKVLYRHCNQSAGELRDHGRSTWKCFFWCMISCADSWGY